jgi:hypothetical protein
MLIKWTYFCYLELWITIWNRFLEFNVNLIRVRIFIENFEGNRDLLQKNVAVIVNVNQEGFY